MKSKTSEAQKRASAKWMKKACKRYTICLRYDIDSELISMIAARQASGTGTTAIFREALKKLD